MFQRSSGMWFANVVPYNFNSWLGNVQITFSKIVLTHKHLNISNGCWAALTRHKEKKPSVHGVAFKIKHQMLLA